MNVCPVSILEITTSHKPTILPESMQSLPSHLINPPGMNVPLNNYVQSVEFHKNI